MELIDLINHVKANVEAGKAPEVGLLYDDAPASAVIDFEQPYNYSVEKSQGEKLYIQWSIQRGDIVSVNYNVFHKEVREMWQWLAEREQTLKSQADAWEAVWDKLRDVCGLKFGSYNGTGTEVALQAIDDLVARAEGKIIHVKLPAQAMTGEQFYNEVWKPCFDYTTPWNEITSQPFIKACETTAARLISPRKLTGQDVREVLGLTGVLWLNFYWDEVAEKLNAK